MSTMSTEPKERWRELCEKAVVEQDPEKFLATILKLIQTLEADSRTTARSTQLAA